MIKGGYYENKYRNGDEAVEAQCSGGGGTAVCVRWGLSQLVLPPGGHEALLEEAQKDTQTAGEDTGVTSVDAITDNVEVVNDGEDYNALLTQATTDTTVSDYFSTIRLARQESRDSAVELLQETIAYETGADDQAASSASTQLENMVTTALKEAEIEGLIISKGYADYMADGAISVAGAAPEEGLEADAVAQICDIVTTQSDYTPSELKIIEVK